ncbi:HD domain-containing protein [Sesbania bispinosa]|nr:HD domain-containing protein [Sesbania bispinosa]
MELASQSVVLRGRAEPLTKKGWRPETLLCQEPELSTLCSRWRRLGQRKCYE